MEVLRGHFESLRFSGVETYIASGNVIFESSAKSAPALETTIERHLERNLGYPVDTFLRTMAELGSVATYEAFTPEELGRPWHSIQVMFLKRPLPTAGEVAVRAFDSEQDHFRVKGREIYWLARAGVAEASFSQAAFGKAVGMTVTVRNMNTVRKLVAKYPTSRRGSS
jgi:uncharacterized protein (DUF1697 family)